MTTAEPDKAIAPQANSAAAFGSDPELPLAYAFTAFAGLLTGGALWLWARAEPGWLRWLFLVAAVWCAGRFVAGLFFVGHGHTVVRTNREWAQRLDAIRSEMVVRLRQEPELRAGIEAFVYGNSSWRGLVYSPPAKAQNGLVASVGKASAERLADPLRLQVDCPAASPLLVRLT